MTGFYKKCSTGLKWVNVIFDFQYWSKAISQIFMRNFAIIVIRVISLYLLKFMIRCCPGRNALGDPLKQSFEDFLENKCS